MIQLVEKILLDACESHNELAAIDSLKKLRIKLGVNCDIHLDDSITAFEKMCCYGVHVLYQLIGIDSGKKVQSQLNEAEERLAKLLVDILFIADRASTIKKYLNVNANDFVERIHRYRKIMKRAAYTDGYMYFEPLWVSKLSLVESGEGKANEQIVCGDVGEPRKTTSIATKYVGGKQLVTIKTVIEQEVSMYIDVNLACPKFIKIYMPHLEEPIFISRVIKKYVKFARLFDGKSKENTLSYYYKFNKNESTLEFIDEDMENEVAELLGVNLIEKEYVDEEMEMVEAAKRNKLSDEQVVDFKKQLDEVRWSIKNAV